MQGIVGLERPITRIEDKHKRSQNRSYTEQQTVAAAGTAHRSHDSHNRHRDAAQYCPSRLGHLRQLSVALPKGQRDDAKRQQNNARQAIEPPHVFCSQAGAQQANRAAEKQPPEG